MSFVKVWIHFVWSTKDRQPLLKTNIRSMVFQHIRENAHEKEIHLDFIGGYTDQVHCLISLNSDQTIEDVVRLIKGESSHWINRNKLCQGKFAWQQEYFCVSVSPSLVPRARRYVAKQEEHHGTHTFNYELNGFMKRAGFQRFEG